MQQLEQPRWRPSRRQVLWTLAIVAVLTVAVLIGYRYDITLWDWIKLLIVPAAIAGAGLWFNKQQRERELQIADQRAQTDRDIADQRRQDEALQAYLSQIGELLLREERPLHETEKCDVVRTLAWARTKTVLRRLHDGAHKGRVLRFLGEAGLLNKPAPVIDLEGADLREADLRGSYLEEVCLKEADLRGVNLRGAVLGEPDLSGGNLLPYDKQNPDHWSRYSLKNIESGKEDFRASGLTIADLSGASLVGARLCNAYVGGADLRNAELSNADLRGALLSQADLRGAKLRGANLDGANLDGAEGITNEELEQQAASLEGATMPNGQKYEDWLVSKNGEEDKENAGSS